MNTHDYTTSITVDQTPKQVFNAINNILDWWSGKIDGETKSLGDKFTYQYQDMHTSTQKVTESIPNEKIVWHVLEAQISFTENKEEWKGTDIIFEISEKDEKTELKFTHRGLVPTFECYEACSRGWGSLITGNLYKLIKTGQNQPDAFA